MTITITEEQAGTIWDALYGRRSQLLQGEQCEHTKDKADQLRELMKLFNN
jgi:hypothetical protein